MCNGNSNQHSPARVHQQSCSAVEEQRQRFAAFRTELNHPRGKPKQARQHLTVSDICTDRTASELLLDLVEWHLRKGSSSHVFEAVRLLAEIPEHFFTTLSRVSDALHHLFEILECKYHLLLQRDDVESEEAFDMVLQHVLDLLAWQQHFAEERVALLPAVSEPSNSNNNVIQRFFNMFTSDVECLRIDKAQKALINRICRRFQEIFLFDRQLLHQQLFTPSQVPLTRQSSPITHCACQLKDEMPRELVLSKVLSPLGHTSFSMEENGQLAALSATLALEANIHYRLQALS